MRTKGNPHKWPEIRYLFIIIIDAFLCYGLSLTCQKHSTWLHLIQ